MSDSRIQTGQSEPIEVLAVNAAGNPLTGLVNLKVKIRRESDQRYFDWSTNTFVAIPVTLLWTLTEVDPVRAAGCYRLTKPGHVDGFDTLSITNPVADDVYQVVVVQDGPPQNVANTPWVGEIKVGQFVDNIDAPISLVPGLVWDTAFLGHELGGTFGELVSVIEQILNNRLELANGAVANWVLYKRDDVTVLRTYSVTDVAGAAVVSPPTVPARRTRGI